MSASPPPPELPVPGAARQIDLLELIGGSWPPAPKPVEVAEYGSQPRVRRATMQRPERPPAPHSARIKSVNPLAHLTAPQERRRAKHRGSHAQTDKMVQQTKKVETGLLVDVCGGGGGGGGSQQCGGGASSEGRGSGHYDTPPGRGSPSVSLEMGGSEAGCDLELGVGSMVEVATDVDHVYYGVVRWIGSADETLYAGVELEEAASGLGDGSHGGARLFSCAPGRALFVPVALCQRDSRFRDTPPPSARLACPKHHSFGQMECPVVPGVVAPLSGLEGVCGKNRGIQGHHNSCYLDATLFAMFTFTSVFDSLLYRPAEPQDSAHYGEVQRVLRDEIVNPLRQSRYVRADRVMKLRRLLERLSSISGLTSEEKDPEEFLNSLVAQTLRAEPFLKLNSGQEAYYYQLFVEKDDALSLPSVQQLLEQSLLTSGIKLREVPAALIVQMPRFGRAYKMYPRILPSPLLDVTDLIQDIPRQCTVCGALARWECAACLGQCGVGLESTAFCAVCLATTHAHAARAAHKPVGLSGLSVRSEHALVREEGPVPRVYMELFAVLCIETSHYVAFVKAGAGSDAPWCFFDSMADRKGEQNGYNIPETVCMEQIGGWLSEEGARALHEAAPSDRRLPPHAKRLLCDAYMCLYQSPDVAMYR